MQAQAHNLLGFNITTNEEGCTLLILHAHDPEDGRIYSAILHAEPHVADALRLEVGREIPHRPLEQLTQGDIKARHEAFAALVATTHHVSAEPH